MNDKDVYCQWVDELLNNYNWHKTLVGVKQKMNNNFFPAEFLDAVVQKNRKGYDFYDAYAYSLIHSMRCTEKLALCGIYIGATPNADCMARENNVKLNVSDSFDFRFLGGAGGNDGELFIKESIDVEIFNAKSDIHTFIAFPFINTGIPLEVGYTEARTTLIHLDSGMPLARWAYGHEWVYILWRIPRDLF